MTSKELNKDAKPFFPKHVSQLNVDAKSFLPRGTTHLNAGAQIFIPRIAGTHKNEAFPNRVSNFTNKFLRIQYLGSFI